MHRLTLTFAAIAAAAVFGCGGSDKPAEAPRSTEPSGEGSTDDDAEGAKAPAKDDCAGFDVGNLEDVLLKSACEVEGKAPDAISAEDMKGKLAVTLAASPTTVAPGQKADLIVTFANKTKGPLTLHFRIDPVPRFETETYDKKDKRADMPAGDPPPPAKGQTAPHPSEPKVAKITLAANGTARQRVPWEAVKMKWAPDKVRGTPPEKGFPRVPAGPLAKGKYTVKVKTPLVGVSDGELVEPKVAIEIGG